MAKTKIDEALVRQLAALLEETGLTEIEYGAGDWRIRVAKQAGQTVAAATPAAAAATATDATLDRSAEPGAITSPMVGTAYLGAEPGAEPFVKLGDRVTEGQTLLLIEAMKTFNEIRAPAAGEVIEVLVEDKHPVEFGDVLMIVR